MRLQDLVSKLYFLVVAPLISTPADPVRWRIPGMVKQKERLMRLPATEIGRYQSQKIHQLLVYAARHCEFYRKRFAAVGLTKERDLMAENLQFLPLLTKNDLQQCFESLMASGVDRRTWRQNSSGGSTGEPVVLMQDTAYRLEKTATAFVSDRMQGWDFGKRIALLWGAPKDNQAGDKVRGRISGYLHNERLYDSFDMGPAKMERYHDDLQRYQPDNIVAYAGSAFLFARFLLDRGLRPSYPRASVITSAETLTDTMRDAIEHCFQVPVYNRYGSREVGCIGSECFYHSGLHLHLDKHVEVLDLQTAKPTFEEPGRIVLTLLSNGALPLIRYDLGDVGVLTRKSCSCGVNTAVLQNVLGRSSDFIVTPSGRLIHGEYFTHVFYGRRAVRQFQFVQESRTDYTVRIVENQKLTNAQLQEIREEIMAVLGIDANLLFEFPDRIAMLPSGKFRFTISNIKVPLGA